MTLQTVQCLHMSRAAATTCCCATMQSNNSNDVYQSHSTKTSASADNSFLEMQSLSSVPAPKLQGYGRLGFRFGADCGCAPALTRAAAARPAGWPRAGGATPAAPRAAPAAAGFKGHASVSRQRQGLRGRFWRMAGPGCAAPCGRDQLGSALRLRTALQCTLPEGCSIVAGGPRQALMRTLASPGGGRKGRHSRGGARGAVCKTRTAAGCLNLGTLAATPRLLDF
jgi:hypothetical protein